VSQNPTELASLCADKHKLDRGKRSHIGRLAAFLGSRAASGGLRPLADPEIAAHFLAESVAWLPNTATAIRTPRTSTTNELAA
jgi:hypothetical protein